MSLKLHNLIRIVQESVISQQAKLLPASPNSIIPGDWLKSKPSLVQSHMERIADFIVDQKWWISSIEGLEFLDSFFILKNAS